MTDKRVKGLDGLKGLSEEMHEQGRVQGIIALLRVEEKGVVRRLGFTQRGYYKMFTFPHGDEDPMRASESGEPTQTSLKELQPYLDGLATKRGPGHSVLLYHPSEIEG